MKIHKLSSIAKRASLVGASLAVVAATVLPSIAAFADALNPLTERSLLLTSSAPGYQDTDGAGNSEGNPNAWTGPEGKYYALPGSGPNGKKTGQTFSFKVSTDSAASNRPIKAFTLQYCTTAAGLCQAPGDNLGDARSGAAIPRETNTVAHPNKRSDLDINYDNTAVAGTDFKVFVGGVEQSTGWTVTTTNQEDPGFIPSGTNEGRLTGKRNFVTISRTDDTIAPTFNQEIRIVFVASSARHITNPGSGSFFVKINTYDSDTVGDHIPAVAAENNTHIIDGGVTVANVMTDSIHITTKVLETMAFSVGTRNRDTQDVQHGSCDAIEVLNGNRLNLGNPNAESSLATDTAYEVNSYWRLSSNSSGGATVYYSGDTLRNTVGDKIADMPVKARSQPGTEQFGLALVDAGAEPLNTTTHSFPANHPSKWTIPQAAIWPLNTGAEYADGTGDINGDVATNAQFTFRESSKLVPEVIAQNSDQVISCATAKVRYIGNIAADTPAGVYTTKINYLAAPQY